MWGHSQEPHFKISGCLTEVQEKNSVVHRGLGLNLPETFFKECKYLACRSLRAARPDCSHADPGKPCSAPRRATPFHLKPERSLIRARAGGFEPRHAFGTSRTQPSPRKCALSSCGLVLPPAPLLPSTRLVVVFLLQTFPRERLIV